MQHARHALCMALVVAERNNILGQWPVDYLRLAPAKHLRRRSAPRHDTAICVDTNERIGRARDERIMHGPCSHLFCICVFALPQGTLPTPGSENDQR